MEREDDNMPSRRRFLQGAAIVAGASAFGGSTRILERLTTFAQDPPPDPPNNCPALPTGGAPFVPGSDTRPIVLRKSIAAFTPNELSTLRSAYAALRALPLTDKRAWVLQADLHALYCASCNNSPGDIHGSWSFFPWHRGYLYYYERILGSLVGDIGKFRLPYWDWENIRGLPVAYTTPADSTNSLWDADRRPGLTTGGDLPNGDGNNARIITLNMLSDFSDFGGNAFGAGSVELDPHNLIHVDVGLEPFPWHDMGDLGYAARDPLFFAHHCNIDKLWSRWNDLAAGNGLPANSYTNPVDAGFLNRRWSFYDENQQTVSISAADVLDHQNSLRYVYSPGKLTFKIPRFRLFKCRLICCRPGPDPAPFIEIAAAARDSILAASRLQSPVLLVLRGVRIPPTISGAFDILAVSGERRVTIGSLGIVAHSGAQHTMEPRPATLALDITRAVQAILSKENPATLHVVRRSKQQKEATGFVLQAREAEIRVENR